ncbi:hypothetical protein [Methylobacterium sp. WL6]|uniref:hypothetical protein n=1 Tax=Methylobacterium sp. WL6 TaxID=2603901 RepID=UPI0011C7B9A5|nr:hypothetical protein [Methylobacterium sp. WL6]TXN73438.1 hypothetical protein FV230_01320 [Methylobacterium sp. WL6]
MLATIEDAEDAGDHRIHVGLPDQPAMRSVFIFSALSDAVQVLGALKDVRNVPLWLSTLEVEAEIKGTDLWAALVAARASLDPTDTDCPWVQLAADFASGQVTHTSYGDDGRKHWLHAKIAEQIGRA